ncbi:hypothetical protein ES288_D07G204900v1 [Gossypium darwinii]|uniref:50S ribosomal protein L33, chloroplastic n=2 Tax=Gossypium TaxID=3633 RepID=A0A5D2K9E4_GOSTO|nr:hypothetical protein ES288_D07G204900v1 [Gossypium darwinii]TYH63562.1 hypothetical protein ES332_D07G201400v1 [Gossypium tomentosum]
MENLHIRSLNILEKLGELKTQRRFMAKSKDVQVTIILECTSCVQNGVIKESTCISYRSKLKKFCPYCYKHTIHREIKK